MPLHDGMRVRIVNPAYEEYWWEGTLEIDGWGCCMVIFDDGFVMGVGEEDVEPVG